MSEGFISNITDPIDTATSHQCRYTTEGKDYYWYDCTFFLAIDFIAVLFYTWGLQQAIKVKASPFVKVVASLILFSEINFLASYIYEAAVRPCQCMTNIYNNEEVTFELLNRFGSFLHQQALLLFSVQYLKAAFWLNDTYHLRVQDSNDKIANYIAISLSLLNLEGFMFGILALRNNYYREYNIYQTNSKFVTIAANFLSDCTFLFALIWITLTIRKYGSIENLQLNSCQMVFHMVLLLCDIFGSSFPNQHFVKWRIVASLVQLSVVLSLLFIMYRFPNDSFEKKTHCKILNREVPLIVMLQNRVSYVKYMRQQEYQDQMQERNDLFIMEQAEENLRNYIEDSHRMESIISNVFMTQSIQIDLFEDEPIEDSQSQDSKLYYNRLNKRSRSIEYSRQKLAFDQQLLTSELDDRNSL